MSQTLNGYTFEDCLHTCFHCGFIGNSSAVVQGEYYDPELNRDVFLGWVCIDANRCLDREQVQRQTLRTVEEWLENRFATDKATDVYAEFKRQFIHEYHDDFHSETIGKSSIM